MAYPFKICDPIHGFIRFGELEKQVINSWPFQRLRYIHQMGVAYLVYPGATHTRFEHSLGVMELATRIYNTLMSPSNQLTSVDKTDDEIVYWRQILRLAALCHDLGHLPFSHTAEKTLLPKGGHEKKTLEIISSPDMRLLWRQIAEDAEKDIIKLAVADSGYSLSIWEKVLSQIITEDNFGADRIDYLIRDGRYSGVGFGRFDYHQLIDCLRILPKEKGLTLGITASGIQSVESLWIARYMMFARVYHHPKTRSYSNHLNHFMERHYQGKMPGDIKTYLNQTDYTLLAAIAAAAYIHDYDAECLLKQKPSFQEISIPPGIFQHLAELKKIFADVIMIDEMPYKKMNAPCLVYLEEENKCISCFEASALLGNIPPDGKPLCLFVRPDRVETVKKKIQDLCESAE